MRITILTDPVDLRNTETIFQQVVQLCFLSHLWMFGVDWLKFYCDFFILLDVKAAENLSERTWAKFAAFVAEVEFKPTS